jgi:Glycosyl hydrolases family 43
MLSDKVQLQALSFQTIFPIQQRSPSTGAIAHSQLSPVASMCHLLTTVSTINGYSAVQMRCPTQAGGLTVGISGHLMWFSWSVSRNCLCRDHADDEKEDGTFIMYYAASSKTNPGAHCVGTASSRSAVGPYEAADEALVCSFAQGGAIDPNCYQDPSTKLRYVLYKIDGNNNGNGGECKNGVEPIVPTPIKLQQVSSDGVSPIGEPVTILDRDDSDGPLVEAPSLYRSSEGVYFLFFSSGCYSEPSYSVKYATATDITGPYTKAPAPLLKSGDGPNLNGPGGAHISADGRLLVFHAITNFPGQPLNRAMFTANPTFSGTTVTL